MQLTTARLILREHGADDWPAVLAYQSDLRYQRFYLINVPTATVSLANMLAYEHEIHCAYRWWMCQELEQSQELFVPADLPHLLSPLLAGAIPATPLLLSR
jgi:hypothetical protein